MLTSGCGNQRVLERFIDQHLFPLSGGEMMMPYGQNIKTAGNVGSYVLSA
jgi:hypothetical protein